MAGAADHHEFGHRQRAEAASSDRAFGLVFTCVSLIAALYYWWTASPYWRALVLAGAVFLGLALLRPSTLSPLNRLWTWFGLLLGKIVNPILLGIVFLAVVLPTAVVARIFRKDFLGLTRNPAAPTYWIERRQDEAIESSMKQQF
ncbi:MAG: hypothetical protein HY056_07685 [Proteobacteria bacterium]|nr:hypothetical protein [Pseudomonadota bacterium]